MVLKVQSSLARKVFLAVFGTAALLVLVMTLALVWRVDRSFVRYVHQIELQRLQGLVGQLERDWRRHGDWREVPAEPEAFRRWFDRAMGDGWRPAGGRPRPDEGPPPGFDAPPGPPFVAAGRGPPEERPPRDARPRPDRRPPPDRLTLVRRVALFDAQGRPFAGAELALDRETALPVEVEGQTVAWVGLQALRLPAEQGERAFLREQWRDALLVGAAALLLSALVSMAFARHLRRPVRQLVDGTRALTEGQLETRMPVERRDEFGLLAEHFNRMAGQLQRQERVRREWLASTSHELRTPLSVLRGLIEALQEGIRQGDPATLRRLHDQVMTLSRLVDDLHDLARHDAGSVRLDRQPLHPRALIDDVLDAQRQRLGQAGIVAALVDHSHDARIEADPQRLAQLVHNLLENSCRYTDAPGRLQIGLSMRQDEAGRRLWCAEFDDSAPGPAAADLPRLFERFYRGEASRSRATGGTGLGLSICRAIAEEHGGRIDAGRSPLGGLRVTLLLPA